MNIDIIRNNFPYINNGLIYFNHASSGPLQIPVLNSINERLTICSAGEIDDYLKFLKIFSGTKEMLAKLINSEPDRISFCDNTTNGLNIIAQGLKWNKGDRVLLNDIEFPANVYPFLNLKEYGVEVDFVKSNNGIVSAEAIIDAIKPETKLVSISFVQFLTGYKADLELLGRVCRQKGIIFCVDAIQGLGALKLDVEKMYIDYLSCGTQKWMLGLQGLAFIFITKELQKRVHPKYTGWLSVENAWNLLDYKLELRQDAEFIYNGTLNTLGIYALNASLKLFFDAGIDEIENRVIENSSLLISELQESGFAPILAGQSKKYLSGIVSFKHEKADEILKYLNANNVSCAVREGIVRFSPHYYNTGEEILKVCSLLKACPV